MSLIPVLEQCTVSYLDDKHFLADHLSYYLQKNHDLVFPHRHNFYQLLLFNSGAGYHEIDFKRYAVIPGQVYLMGPGQVHSWMFEGEITGYIINFDVDYFKSLLLQSNYLDGLNLFSSINDGVLEIDRRNTEEVSSLMSQLVELNVNSKSVDLKRSLLLYILLKLEELYIPTFPSKGIDYHLVLVKNFTALIDQHYKEYHLPKEYANLLYVTPNHLNAVCKEYLGLQAGEIIRNRMLLEAKRLLILPDWSITQIAYELNFNDNSYFSKFFKKLAGVTPEEFRRSQWK